MRAAARLILGLALAVPGLFINDAATAQANQAHTHLANVTDRYTDTPSNRGLVATATAEATVAAQHASMGAEATDNLGTMKLHAGHVINCVDPTLEADGPCLGYGIKKAMTAAIKEMESAAAVPGASASVRILSSHILASSRNSIRIADLVVENAKKVQAATDVTVAAEIMALMAEMAGQIQAGFDFNRDGTLDQSEGGLTQVTQRAALLKRAEGIGTPGAP
jgi:hypothetical protein